MTAWAALAALGMAGAGCDYSASDTGALPSEGLNARTVPQADPTGQPGASAGSGALSKEHGAGAGERSAPSAPSSAFADSGDAEQRTAILNNVVKLIQSAATNPGGASFANAIKNLNQYFEGAPATEYALTPQARAFLEAQPSLNKKRVDELATPAWTMPDARHVEDCMLYHGIANRVCGPGDDLTRARRVFDWMVRQIQLVPAGSLGAPGLGQAYARPYDVLLRGMATESEGFWSERGWLFLSLCRQLGLDGGLVTYTPPNVKEPIIWCCAILVDEKVGETVVPRAYLFDTRIGLPIPDAKGTGVATIDDVLADPAVLDRMDLPGQSPYGTTRVALANSPTKIGILLDSSLRYFSPRMRLLQRSLAGKDLTVLYRDPALQRDHWEKALGPHLGKVGLWELPMAVETLLFSNPQFVQSTQQSLFLFRSDFPLLFARMKQLRGETSDAIQDYVSFRFAEHSLLMDKKTRMPPEVQAALDVYATYYLGMCHLDQDDPKQAEFFFDKALKMLPLPGGGQPFFNMYRWGAQANLARLREAKGDVSKAIAYYSQNDPTAQRHGNLLRARDLVWRDPTAPRPDPLPDPPSAVVRPFQAAAANAKDAAGKAPK
jgi:hypothetical protein